MADWPIYYKELLKCGRSDSQVGIVTLWTICDEIVKYIDKGLYCAAGQLYTKNGINYLVRNLLANKSIRYLIVCGQDRSGSGLELANLWKTGKSESLHKEISPESVKKMVENVKLINLNTDSKKIAPIPQEIVDTIKKLKQNLPSYGEPETFPEPKNEALNELECRFPSDASVYKVRGRTVAQTWVKILRIILKFGDIKETDGMKIKEILNLAAVVYGEDPDNFYVPDYLGFDLKKVEEYIPQIVGKEKISGLHYTYGYRLGSHFGVDQVEKIIERLKNDPNAREALGVLFDPKVDIEAQHRPCVVLVQALRNQDKLNFTAYIRSNDIYGGWPLNAFGLRKLQQKIADASGLPLGDLTLISGSAHMYDFNFTQAQKIASENIDKEIEIDPRGHFVVKADNEKKEIIASHFGPEGQLLGEYNKSINEPKAALELAKDIDKALGISLVSHAFDLGIELQKAETALRMGKDYTQDKPFLFDE